MTTMMMDRTAVAMPGMGVPGMGTPGTGTHAGMTPGGYVMVPRCTLKFEKCTGGMKISCTCEDAAGCGMLQNLCTMLAGGMCSCCMMLNGMTVCSCNLTMGMCKCETTDKGVSVTCTSGDAKCCEMIQACCDCMNTMLQAGCSCCVMMNNTPVCCGTAETAHHAPAKSGKR